MTKQNIPFVDLRAQNDEVRDKLVSAFTEILDNSSFVGGKWVDSFEKNFAHFCDCNFAVSCSTGTDALKLALMAAGIQAGDEVITVSHTFIATVEAMVILGATPRLVDIDPDYYTLSPKSLESWLENNCKVQGGITINKSTNQRVAAVIPVHLYGTMADMAAIQEILSRYSMALIEDACQAHGAVYRQKGAERRAGSFGVASAFSFYPAKNLGALGEGGAATTNEEGIAKTMRLLRAHGEIERYVHVTPRGWNCRLSAIQAAWLDIKLACLDGWNANRQKVANWYQQYLGDFAAVKLPSAPPYASHVYHLFVIRLADRDQVRTALAERGVQSALHYPIPIHLQEAFRSLGLGRGSLPITEMVADSILSLPMFPHMTEEQVAYVCKQLREVVSS